MADTRIHTYHCVCNELALAIFGQLDDARKRSKDKSSICPVAIPPTPSKCSVTLAATTHIEQDAAVLKLEDGFEKRYAVKCGRCDLQIGYMLDKASFEEGSSGMRSDMVYLLPGGLMETEEMREGKDMSKEIDLVAGAAG